MGCKPTGRFCERAGCGAPLRDKAIDWHTTLPEEEFEPAIANHQQAELALCLGTSLRIRPAGNMPLRTLRKHKKDAPGRLVIVNLQKTHLDRSASMRLHVRTDALFRELCRLLDVPVKEEDTSSAASASAAAAAEDAKHAAAAAASAAMPPPPPRKAKTASTRPAVARATRERTQRLRHLYNPTMKEEAEEADSATASSTYAASAAAASTAAAAASPEDSACIPAAASSAYAASSPSAAAQSAEWLASAPVFSIAGAVDAKYAIPSPAAAAAAAPPHFSSPLKRAREDGDGAESMLPAWKEARTQQHEGVKHEAEPHAAVSMHAAVPPQPTP